MVTILNSNSQIDNLYMQRCLQLASCGKYETAPNPMVGAVIVCKNRIIGEGYHIRAGEAHAEVRAVQSVSNHSLLSQSTLYVSLEPCSHWGKTPPCADLIIKVGIPRVVIGSKDPFALVDGTGIQKLQQAGIEVTVGVLQDKCADLNKHFLTFHSKKRPYITLKWAHSADGFIDQIREILNPNNPSQKPIVFSTPLTQMLAHKRRTEHQAILIGRHTALLDNPSLNSRAWIGQNPLRFIIDKDGSLPHTLSVFNKVIPTFIFCSPETAKRSRNTNSEKKENSEINPSIETRFIALDFATPILPQILAQLHQMGIQSLLVEGGAQTLQSFIDSKLWDVAFIEEGRQLLKSGITAPKITGSSTEKAFFGQKIKVIMPL